MISTFTHPNTPDELKSCKDQSTGKYTQGQDPDSNNNKQMHTGLYNPDTITLPDALENIMTNGTRQSSKCGTVTGLLLHSSVTLASQTTYAATSCFEACVQSQGANSTMTPQP